jgi:hypothetical protein
MAVEEIRAIRISPKKGLVNQGGQHPSADVFAQRKQALRLGKHQAQPWHLAILHLDSPQELRTRGDIPAFSRACMATLRRHLRRRSNAERAGGSLWQLEAKGSILPSHLRHTESNGDTNSRLLLHIPKDRVWERFVGPI